jgi:large subunit ribosomal protein L31
LFFGENMKKETHPEYRDVLFVDSSTGFRFVCGSTLASEEVEKFQGKEYPVCRVSISSASHPFFTGSKQLVDAEGRVDKFMKRYANKAVPKKPSEEEMEEDLGKEKPKKAAKTKEKKKT